MGGFPWRPGGHVSSTPRPGLVARWILLVIVGLGVVLVFVPGVKPVALRYTPSTSSPTPESRAGVSAEEPFLADYDPQADPLLYPAGEDAEQPQADASWGWMTYVELLAKFGLVIGLTYLVLNGLKRLQRGGRSAAANGSTTIQILETTGLAPNRTLHLVSVGEKTLLIGATEHQVSLLAELSDTAFPMVEENQDFEDVLQMQAQAVFTERPEPLPAGEDEENDWRLALDHLRSSVQCLRKSVGG